MGLLDRISQSSSEKEMKQTKKRDNSDPHKALKQELLESIINNVDPEVLELGDREISEELLQKIEKGISETVDEISGERQNLSQKPKSILSRIKSLFG